MISGFIIVKDVLKPGYPFVEAIASALPICDEFLISDGYSTDGTYEVVERIAKMNSKVKVFRQEWPKEKKFTVLAEVTNWIRAKCNGDYIFSIQANEVVHEESVKILRALPEMCPKIETFSLPFLHVMRSQKFSEEFRLRFSKNLPSIIAIGDAWSLGTSKEFVRSEVIRSLKNPSKLSRYIGRGVQWTYANTCGSQFSKAFHLPKPIFRYWSLFPRNYIEKCLKHREMFNLQHFTEVITNLEAHLDDEASHFWELAVELFRNSEIGFKYPGGLGDLQTEDHPRIMKGLISDLKAKSYYVREELFDKIQRL
jgi:hypothetical protein